MAHGHGLCTANVVRMLVRDEDGVDVVQPKLCRLQPPLQLADAKAAIDQEPPRVDAVAPLDDGGIARAAAAQILEAQHGREVGR